MQAAHVRIEATALPPHRRAGLRLLVAGALAAALCAGAHAAQPVPPAKAAPEVVTVGVFTIAPYVIASRDGAQGALIAFFDREIAPRMGVRFKWEMPTTVARLEQSLASDSIAFTPLLIRTKAREDAGIVFVGDKLISFEPCIAVLPGSPLNKITSQADLAGMTIGWVRAGVVPTFMLDKRIKLELAGVIDWERTNIAKLAAGQLQGVYFSDRITPQYYGRQNGVGLKLLRLPTPPLALHSAFSPGAPTHLRERYRKAVRTAFANGRFESYMHQALALPPR
ncbi:substrate-binding periplasmic protein [Massilia glaciei]|uniref:Uncharacterized protein n=1 Tax=Massilia glaciei TaxID=1524097 RepID=A0A2U2I6W1_9BURK|nr:transporter substrate-binding domain-containing protein [Massilia glaciei]PWF55508.1 hypothetical protein C7C56_001435 [Massilia glaciei]